MSSVGANDSLLLKLQRCAPRAPQDLNTWCKLTRLFFRMAALLPHHQVAGLGEEQMEVVKLALRSVSSIARSAMRSPAGELTAPLVELLRFMTFGTPEREAEMAYNPSKHNAQLLTHRYMRTAQVGCHVDGLAQAELFYESLCAGLRCMEKLASDPPHEVLDDSMEAVPVSVALLGLVFLFDGCRLRRGLEVGMQVTVDSGHSFGLDRGMAAMLSDGESNTERVRVGVSFQFLLAACIRGCEELADQLPPNVLARVSKLRSDAHLALHSCRAKDLKGYVPGQSMRVLLDLVAELVDEIALGVDNQAAELVVRIAFAYPCLVPCGLEALGGYDNGLLSVWDACLHLFHLHASRHNEVLSYPSLIAAVLAGVVGSLMTPDSCGPFRLHSHSDVAALVSQIGKSWPETPLGGPSRQPRTRGKTVSVNASVRGSMDDVFRIERKSTLSSEAKTACSLSMLSINQVLLQGPGVYEGAPTDSISAIKRMYIACFATEAGGGAVSVLAGAAVNALWRDLLCGALIYKGPLCSFTRSALRDSLRADWCSERSAESGSDGTSASTIKMLPAVASALVFSRAAREVEDVTSAVIQEVEERNGPVYVVRVCETARALSSIVHATRSAALWELLVSRFCTPRGRKRPLGELGEPGEPEPGELGEPEPESSLES